MKDSELKVFFDGDCRVCAHEISIYRRAKSADKIHFVDIMQPDFKAEEEGLDPKKVHEIFHVKNSSGEVFQGVAGFREIWRRLPEWQWAYRISKPKAIQALMNLGYQIFLRIRPFLPRKKSCRL